MIPQQWVSPCGNKCTNKYSALTKIPWRVFCKKGCNSDGESWEECLEDCNQICYKDPVLKDQQWSAYIDRSPGAVSYSEECFRACVSGCSYKLSPVPSNPPFNWRSIIIIWRITNAYGIVHNILFILFLGFAIIITIHIIFLILFFDVAHIFFIFSPIKNILLFDVKPEEADKVCPNRQTKPSTEPVQKPKPKPQLVHPIDPPDDIPGTSA
ncbi:hypothetical protein ACSQ67_004336 [Phaseolus vulgaris]